MKENRQCQLLGGIFETFIQACLAILCIGTLIVKRQNEVPRREWIVWFLDVFKQGLGSSFGHFSNIFLSVIIAQSIVDGDECQWYCLTYVIDATFGTLFSICFLSCFERVVSYYQYAPEYLNFGEYGDPPNMYVFSLQLAIWMVIVILTKVIILFGLLLFLTPIDNITSAAFQVFRGHPDVELVMVMIIIPGILNTLQFWITDTFLKKQTNSDIDDSSGIGHSMLNCNGKSTLQLSKRSPGRSPYAFREGHVQLATQDTEEDVDDDDGDEDMLSDCEGRSPSSHWFLHKKSRRSCGDRDRGGGDKADGNSKDNRRNHRFVGLGSARVSRDSDDSHRQDRARGGSFSSYLADTVGVATLPPAAKLYVVSPQSSISRMYHRTGIPFLWSRIFGSPEAPSNRKRSGQNGDYKTSPLSDDIGDDEDGNRYGYASHDHVDEEGGYGTGQGRRRYSSFDSGSATLEGLLTAASVSGAAGGTSVSSNRVGTSRSSIGSAPKVTTAPTVFSGLINHNNNNSSSDSLLLYASDQNLLKIRTTGPMRGSGGDDDGLL